MPIKVHAVSSRQWVSGKKHVLAFGIGQTKCTAGGMCVWWLCHSICGSTHPLKLVVLKSLSLQNPRVPFSVFCINPRKRWIGTLLISFTTMNKTLCNWNEESHTGENSWVIAGRFGIRFWIFTLGFSMLNYNCHPMQDVPSEYYTFAEKKNVYII